MVVVVVVVEIGTGGRVGERFFEGEARGTVVFCVAGGELGRWSGGGRGHCGKTGRNLVYGRYLVLVLCLCLFSHSLSLSLSYSLSLSLEGEEEEKKGKENQFRIEIKKTKQNKMNKRGEGRRQET